MKFSIITPSFNQGRYIIDCLESVKEQLAGGPLQLEHWVIDGGSSDETLSLLAEWKAKTEARPEGENGYVFDFISEPDRGMTDAINKGFARATGDWLMWLNTDDYLMPGALEKVAAFMGKHPEGEVVYGDCHFVGEDKSLIRLKRTGDFSFPVLLFYGCYIQSTACFYRRDLIDGGWFLDAERKVCMDFDYYVRLALGGKKFVYFPEVLAGFRWHGENMSVVQAERRGRERWEVQKAALRAKGWGWLGWGPFLILMRYGWQAYRKIRLL